MEKVLVTGANGFVGSYMMHIFEQKGYDVHGWDVVAGEKYGIKIQKIDMSSQLLMEEKLMDMQPDIVVHCAGSADVGFSVKNPLKDYEGNVTLTHNLLFALHKIGMDNTRVLMLSSAAVYGNPKRIPIHETAELNPLSPYALHKVMCEEICAYFTKNYGMDIRVARIFSAYGVGLRKQIFWDMYHKVSDTGCLNMFGTGNESRDYINIEDLIEALYLITVAPSKEYYIYNVANGEEITIRKATEIFANYAGITEEYISFNSIVREGEPLNWCADISRLKSIGYEKHVKMEDGLKKYYDWAKMQ